ncbi:hypothetical protein L227DRAFT_313929 [Lentinus tigrinus ALCF2SS1-6]|uniref:DUF6697 domain-containing protein n=1 Tax=Lentinus tigrinus ALCF2SS1-6 TaxID=1328759 RepID=A0A5C2RVR0_9APHY|nr:hypothetical protein L227DRAFT_313929 [Lentinus tigrinus ALCF2SS1-6]
MALPTLTVKLEDNDQTIHHRPESFPHVKSNHGDLVSLLEKRGVTPDPHEQSAKAEDWKTGITLVDDTYYNQEPEDLGPVDAGPQAAISNTIIREGKTLARVEVVLPRWSDVLRCKLHQARSQPRHPPPLDAPNTAAVNFSDGVDIKMEPCEDSKPLSAELERHDAAHVAWAIQDMRHPDVKVKKELLLSDEYLLYTLTWEGINHRYRIPVPQEIAEFPLPRAYIVHLYGGNLQSIFTEPRKDLVEWHGLKDWAFLTLDWNPHAPTRPGCSGLFFCGARQNTDDMPDPMRTFVRIQPGKWVYMGQYRFRPGKSLTAEHWKQQSALVRRTWTRAYMVKGYGMRTRIWLRRQKGSDYKLTEADYAGLESKQNEIKATVTEEDINAAFDRGEEEMGVYTMTCVGYDEEFIRLLVRNLHRWDPPAPKTKQDASGAEKRQSRKGMGSKRKPISVESETEESDKSADEPWIGEEEDEDVKVPVSVPTQEPERRSARKRVKRVRTS